MLSVPFMLLAWQSFCWFWHYEGHTVMEHGMVFWVAPIVGAVLAGMLCIETKVCPSFRSRYVPLSQGMRLFCFIPMHTECCDVIYPRLHFDSSPTCSL
jgi:hypothetical protein